MSDPLPFPSPGDHAPALSDDILDTAALHLARRDRGTTRSEDDAFTAWLAADPRHRAAVNRLSSAWAALDALQPVSAAPAPLPARQTRRLWPWLAAAACFALLLGIVVRYSFPGAPAAASFACTTPLGVTATHLLPDGTRLHLNTDTLVDFSETSTERRARLARGEACFEVAADPGRPFVVEIDTVRVRVVGTIFNLRRHPGRIDLIVAEGRVRIAYGPNTETLGPGDRTSLDPTAPATSIHVEHLDDAAVERALAWRDGRLVFAATPLSEALDAFSRHHRVRFEITDPSLAGLLIGGAYSSTDLDGFLTLLQTGFGVRVERVATDHVRLHRASPPGT